MQTGVQVAEPGGGGGATEDGFQIIDACIQYEGPASGEVCDNQEGDDSPEQGVVLISNVPAGDYSVAMPNPPEGFDAAPPVDVTVADGELAAVELPVGGVTPEEPEEPEEEEEETVTRSSRRRWKS